MLKNMLTIIAHLFFYNNKNLIVTQKKKKKLVNSIDKWCDVMNYFYGENALQHPRF
jgi:hypothetical protein